jgi:hypothetical protein
MKTLHSDAALKVISGIARKADFESLGIDNVRALKSDTEHPQYRSQGYPVVKDTSDAEERTFTWRGSTEQVDSMGDVLLVKGWDLTRVKTGMCHILLGHDSYPLPAGLIGSGNKSAKMEDGTRCLDLTGRIFELDIYNDSEFGKHVEGARKLIARNDLKGSSVGFIPLEGGFRWPDEKERETYGMPPWGGIFEAQELLELSITPIPANRGASKKKDLRAALKQLVADGQIEQGAADLLAEDLSQGDEAWMRRVQSIERVVVPVSRSLLWIKCGKASAAPAASSSPTVDEAVEAVKQAGIDSVRSTANAVLQILRREMSPTIREVLEPLVDVITDGADEMQDAAKRLGLERKDSERAEVRKPSAPNGADAASAESTGTSRDNPTTQAVSRAGDLLLRALDPTYVGADTAHGSPDRSNQAAGVQERR